MNDAIHRLLFKRAESRWQSYYAPSFFAKIGGWLFGSGHPPIAIYLTEHFEADWPSTLCAGVVVRAWKQDQDGCKEVSVTEVDPGEPCGHYWTKQLMRFHISPDGQRVLWNDIEGPQRAQLVVFAVGGTPDEPTLTVEKASLCL
ncbi:MAG: hypothetical protein FJ303_02200 [Planctomycetes bacterium]|nr:hypothetical protein [Planctomycetota bacterium]